MIESSTIQPRGSAPPTSAFANILCAVDGTRTSLAGVEQAVALAGAQGRLTLLAVTAVSGEGRFQQAAIAPVRAQRLLDDAAQIADAAGVRCTQVIDPEQPAGEVIIARAAAHDLLVLGAPATSRLTELFVGGVASETLKQLPCPILFARAASAADEFAKRIVVASDGSPESDDLVEAAAQLAHDHGADVILLHSEDSDAQHAGRVREQAARLNRASPGACELRIVAGPARAAIVETLPSTGASLVMMGSSARRGLHTIGSVSARVVHDAPCSVLLMPPDAKGENPTTSRRPDHEE